MNIFPEKSSLFNSDKNFNDISYLLIWGVGGRMRYFVDSPSMRITCNEFDRDVNLEYGLGRITPPMERLKIKPFPSFSIGSAGFNVRFPDLKFSPDLAIEGTPCELSIIEDGTDLYDRIVLSRGVAQGISWEQDGVTVNGSVYQAMSEDASQIPRNCITPKTWPLTDAEKVFESSGGNYQLLYGSGKLHNVKCIAVKQSGQKLDTPRNTYLICEGWLPNDVKVDYLKFIQKDSDRDWITLDKIPYSDYSINLISDNKKEKITVIELDTTKYIQISAKRSEIYVTLSWKPRPEDTIGGAMRYLLEEYASLNVPAPILANNGEGNESHTSNNIHTNNYKFSSLC